MLKNQQSFAPHFPLDDFLHRRRHEPWKGNWWQSCAFCSSCNQLIYSWPSQMFRNPCVTACNTLQTIPERRLWTTWSSSNAKALIFGRRMVHLLSWFPTHPPFPSSKPLSWTCLCCLLAKFTVSSLFIRLLYCWAAVTCHGSLFLLSSLWAGGFSSDTSGSMTGGSVPVAETRGEQRFEGVCFGFDTQQFAAWRQAARSQTRSCPWEGDEEMQWCWDACRCTAFKTRPGKALISAEIPFFNQPGRHPDTPAHLQGLGRDDTARYLAISLLFSAYVKGKHYKYSQCFEGNCQQDLWGQGPYAADQHPFPQGHSATSRLAFLSFKDTFKGDTFSRSSGL